MSWSIYKSDGNSGSNSITSPENLGAAQEHKITIDIMPSQNDISSLEPLATVDGFMREPFSYSIQASYANILSDSVPNMLAFNMFKDLTQRNESFNSGYGSKKMFQPGNAYVKLNLKFRVYDDVNAIARCDLLTKCCLPIMSRNNFMLDTNALRVGAGIVREMANVIGDASASVVNGGGVGEASGKVLTSITDNTTTKMPPHLRVTIGSYFKKSEMVLTGCEFSFSKEFSRKGGVTYPTYVDFDLAVESLYSSLALSSPDDNNSDIKGQIFGPGFTTNSQQARVFIGKEEPTAVQRDTNELATLWKEVTSIPGLATSTPKENR